MLLDVDRGATVIPTSAIERGQQGTYVYRRQAGQHRDRPAVTLGPTEGERVAVLSGLAVGERVVVDGADRLKEGDGRVVQHAGSPAGRAAGAPAGGRSRRRDRRSGPGRREIRRPRNATARS